MARVRVLGKFHRTIEILESRLSCDCEYIKAKIEKHLRYQFFERISGRGNNEKISSITKANREEFEDNLKHRLTWALMEYEGYGTPNGFHLFEFFMDMENTEVRKFPIVIHKKSSPSSESHEAIHYEAKIKINCDQIFKVGIVVRDYDLHAADGIIMEPVGDSEPED